MADEPLRVLLEPSADEMLDVIVQQKADIARLTRERDEWKATAVHADQVSDRLSDELRRLLPVVRAEYYDLITALLAEVEFDA